MNVDIHTDLCSDILEEVLDVFPDEGVLHDGLPVHLENFFKVVDVIVLVGRDEVGHGQNLRVILVRLGLLNVKRLKEKKISIFKVYPCGDNSSSISFKGANHRSFQN